MQVIVKGRNTHVPPHLKELATRKLEKVERTPEPPDGLRGFGALKGKIWMAPDFDAPLDDFKDYM